MSEIWRELEGFSKYKFSNTGKVWSKHYNKTILFDLKRGGYARITLINDEKKQKHFSVHRLIALTFIPNPENKPTVNHKNHNRADNRVENLEWATMAEQNNDKKKQSSEITRCGRTWPVWRCSLDGEKLEYYEKISDAEKWLYINIRAKRTTSGKHISYVCRNKRKTAYGFKWIFDTSEEKIFENEIWKDIPKEFLKGNIGYKISDQGRIKKSENNGIFKGTIHDAGYKVVTIGSGKGRTHLIHRLVAKVFLPNYYGKPFVNHKDHNKANCKLYNLEWVTASENTKLAVQFYSSKK
tara:strand:+ start:2088 stop:2975 length:888 start_codon:yes stop_codon:yes gene_type:complete